jgi:PAS domain S-box-containing protein
MSLMTKDPAKYFTALFEWITSFWPSILFGVVAVVGGLIVGGMLRDREGLALERATGIAHDAVFHEVEDHINDRLRALERLGANWERHGGLPRAEFEAEAVELAQDLSFLQAIEWVGTEFRVRWVVPLAGNEAAVGLDLAFEPRRRPALEMSRDRRVTTLSRPIQLVQGGLGFLVYVPLEVDGRFDGFVVGVCRAADLFAGILRNVAPGFAVRIADDGELLYVRGDSETSWDRLSAGSVLNISRPWSIDIAPHPEMVATYRTRLPLLVAAVGVALALGIGIASQIALSRRLRNLQLADEMERREELEQKLARILDAHPDHVWSGEVTSEGFEMTYVSPRVEDISGYPPETFKHSEAAWYEIVHEADIDTLTGLIGELIMEQRDRFDLEYRIRAADGTLVWVRERVRSTPMKRGRFFDGTTTNITEARRAAAERLRTEKQSMLVLERERMTREMHDGIGGLLVSTIAMLERGRSKPSEVVETLRRALDDMRIAIDSLDPTTTDLPTSLGKLRARLEPLLRRNGIALCWQVEGVPGLDAYPPEQTLHFLRIIQEAVTNAVRHAKPSEVGIRIRAAAGPALSVEIHDDGCGFAMDAVSGGRGILHMKARAEALDAELRFDPGDPGTRIEMRVPIPH